MAEPAVKLDPVSLALLNAPPNDAPLTDEERQAVEEGKRALREGRYVTDEELCRRLGL
jgi:hypothetical protein